MSKKLFKDHGDWFKSDKVAIRINSQQQRTTVENFAQSIGLTLTGYPYRAGSSDHLRADRRKCSGYCSEPSDSSIRTFDCLTDFLTTEIPQSIVTLQFNDAAGGDQIDVIFDPNTKIFKLGTESSGRRITITAQDMQQMLKASK